MERIISILMFCFLAALIGVWVAVAPKEKHELSAQKNSVVIICEYGILNIKDVKSIAYLDGKKIIRKDFK